MGFFKRSRKKTSDSLWIFYGPDGEVLLCLNDEEKFWSFYNRLYGNTSSYAIGVASDMDKKSHRIRDGKMVASKACVKPTVLITIDETGDKGKSRKEDRFFIVAGCVVNDKESFDRALDFDINRLYDVLHPKDGKAKELKFYWDRTINTADDHERVRERVIKQSIPAVSRVYYIQVIKPKDHQLSDELKKELQTDMVRTLADKMMSKVSGTQFDVIVDKNSDMSSSRIKKEIEALDVGDKDISCDVRDSSKDRSLMVNDFYVGSIGAEINKDKRKYTKLMKDNGITPKNLNYRFSEEELASKCEARKKRKQEGT